MLKPQISSTRDVVSLDGIWNFAVGTGTDIENEIPWQTQRIPPILQIPVPASYNDIFVDKSIRDHVGWVFYQRTVRVPRGWRAAQCFLRFDAATHHGRVYVNEQLVAEHSGGYTPFEADITNLVQPGEEFSLTVAVSNVLTWDTIPPGVVETSSTGVLKQTYHHDFFNYSGLARSVWLCSVPEVSIQDITVLTDTKGTTGIVDYNIVTNQEISNRETRVTLLDEGSRVVSESLGQQGRFELSEAQLWQPGKAYLYQLHAEILSKDGTTTDSYKLSVGIRSVRVEGNRFLINGKPFYFTGFGKHEDSLIRGKGHDNATMIHDFHLMKWSGANSFRTAHYPYAEEVLEYADRHGIVVIDETAAVGLHLNIIAGVFGLKHRQTFCPEAVNDRTQAAHAQAIRELIARDKNHPSVVLWCLANEPDSAGQGVREYMEPLVKLTRQLDPSRPICFSNMVLARVEQEQITDLFDVLCLNRYFGWYVATGDLVHAEEMLERDLLGWEAAHGKPIIVAEYGADTQVGVHSALDDPWSEEFQGSFLEMYHRVFDRVESVVGEHVWNFADFQTTSSTHRVDGNKKGVFTRDRKPKMSAHVLRRRWTNRLKST